MSESQNRQVYLDVAKGIGIFLVVYGHVQIGLTTAGLLKPNDVWKVVIYSVYSVHMPLFFLISGYFAQHSLPKKAASVAAADIIRYLVLPYIFWSIVHLGLRYEFSGVVNRPLSLSDVFTLWIPKDQFWFLFALAVSYCVALGCALLKIHPVFSLLGAAILFWFRLDYAGVVYGLLYFSMGMVAARMLGRVALDHPMFRLDAAVVSAALCAATIAYCYIHHVPYSRDVIGALAGIFAIVFLSRLIRREPLRTLGEYSFYIFVMHVIFASGLRVVLEHAFHLRNVAIHLILGVIVGLVFPVAIGIAARRYRFNRFIFAR